MLDVQQQMLIEQRLANEKPSAAVAYLLDIFLGIFGAHRFYLKRTGSAVTMLVCSITVIGLCVTVIWAFIDLFLIPGMLREETQKLRQKLTVDVMSNTQSASASAGVSAMSNTSAPPVATAQAVPSS